MKSKQKQILNPKSYLVVLFFLCMLISRQNLLAGKELECPLPPDANDVPKIEVRNTPCDIGKLPPNTKYTLNCTVRNVGSAQLEIYRISTCCGIQAVLPKKQLAPSQSTELVINYQGEKVPGLVKKAITLYTNDPQHSKFDVELIGEVIETMRWTPTHIKLHPDRKNAGCGPIKIQSLNGKPFSIQGVQVTNQCMRLDFDPQKKAQEYILQPVVDQVTSRIKPGTQGKILLTLDRLDYPTLSIPFDVVPDLRAIPGQIVLVNAQAQQPRRGSIRLKAKKGTDMSKLELQGHSSAKDWVRILSCEPKGDMLSVQYEIMPPVRGAGRGIVQDNLTLDLKGYGKMEIPVRIFYRSIRASASATHTHGNWKRADHSHSHPHPHPHGTRPHKH